MFVKNLYLIHRSDVVFKILQRHPCLRRADGSQVRESVTLVQESVSLQEKARGLASASPTLREGSLVCASRERAQGQ